MKRKISISAIAFVSLLVQVLVALPHHHHEGVFCMIMEHCERDSAINDEHTQHNDDSEASSHEKSCITEADYIAPEIPKETKCKISCNDLDHTHFFPVLFFLADLLNYSIDDFGAKPEYGEYISFYKSATTSRFHGLRAPPAFLA
ncbi:MAG: hypothetical protein LBS03_02255 [Bacteroidales bacterium]|nr:hypothetical protein [Bacteroidales bacterium]